MKLRVTIFMLFWMAFALDYIFWANWLMIILGVDILLDMVINYFSDDDDDGECNEV